MKTLKSLLLPFVLAIVMTGCASLHRADGSINYPVLVSDFQFSVDEACIVEWLPQDACTLGKDTLNTAAAIAAKNLPNTGTAIKQLLTDTIAKLSPDNHLIPYLSGLVTLLK